MEDSTTESTSLVSVKAVSRSSPAIGDGRQRTFNSGCLTKPIDLRIAALRRFAVAITILNLLGHAILGFESSWAQMVVSWVTAVGLELLLEAIQSRVESRPPRFTGGFGKLVDFLLP